MSKLSDECHTPLDLFRKIDDRYGPCDLDVAATCQNMLCDLWCGRCVCTGHLKPHQPVSLNGLRVDWSNHVVWCNPPYSDVHPWVDKAPSAKRCIMLLNVDPSTRVWREIERTALSVCWLTPRVAFSGPGAERLNSKGVFKTSAASRPSMVVVWERGNSRGLHYEQQWRWK